MKKKNWYKLDNAGKFYSFLNTAVFRFSCTLKKEIDPKLLKQALNETLVLFPSFHVRLKKGFFWYYLETINKEASVFLEDEDVCSKIYALEDEFLFRVTYYKKRINFEASHTLSDGKGSIEFFKCLISKYLILKEKVNVKIVTPSDYEKTLDAFDKYYLKENVKFPKIKKIYKYHGKKNKRCIFFEYHISLKETLRVAHKYKTSLTGLIISVLINSYKELMKVRDYDKTIKIDVPVDLRKYFKSKTSRNFFGVSAITHNLISDGTSFEDIVKNVTKLLKENTNEDAIKVKMNQMISLEKNPFLRIGPLFLKNIVLNIADKISASSSTSSVSNVGEIKLDKALLKHVENINAFNYSSDIKFVICSYKDDLSVGIASTYEDNALIRNFVSFFSSECIEGVMNISKEEKHEKMRNM